MRQRRPRNRTQDQDERQREENQREFVAPAIVTGLVHTRTADVRERNRQNHSEDMLDGPEPEDIVTHRRPEVLKGRPGQRAERDVEDKAKQKLQIEAGDEPEADPLVGQRPRPARSPPGKGASDRQKASEEDRPAEQRVEEQKCRRT